MSVPTGMALRVSLAPAIGLSPGVHPGGTGNMHAHAPNGYPSRGKEWRFYGESKGYPAWAYHWHRFMDYLAEGNTPESFCAQINEQEPILHAWNTGSCWEAEVWESQGAHSVSLFLRGIDCQERMPHETGGELRQDYPLHDHAQCVTCLPQSPALCPGLARPPTEHPAAHLQFPTSCFQRRRWYHALTVPWSLMSCQHCRLSDPSMDRG